MIRNIKKGEGINSGVYKITNLINNKIYIGCTKHLSSRYRTHLSTLKNKTSGCTILQNAVNKYGIENFEFSVLKISSNYKEEEILFFNNLNPDYNVIKETQEKRIFSKESIQKMSLARKGKIPGNKGKKYPNIKREVMSSVIFISDEKTLQFNSIKEAALFFNISVQTIYMNSKKNHLLKHKYKVIINKHFKSKQMTLKKTTVVMLPTNKKAEIGNIYKLPKMGLFNEVAANNHNNGNFDMQPQHLYFISEERVKVSDYYLTQDNRIVQWNKDLEDAVLNHQQMFNELPKSATQRIIIATTDSLIINEDKGKSLLGTDLNEYLPQPSKSFIDKFVTMYNKKTSITECLVEYEVTSNSGLGYNELVYLQHVKENRYIPIKIDANIYQNVYKLGKEDVFEDYELDFKLKVNNNNEITIKRCKESWSREEVIWHLYNATNELGNGSIKSTDVKTYIEQNL